MKLRDWLNNNSAVVTIVAVVILVISLGIIVWQTTGGGGNHVVDVYYYDVNTGEIFLGKSDEIPPIEAPSGPIDGQPAGYRAYVFACGDCPSNSEIVGATPEQLSGMNTFVGWVKKYTQDAKAAIERTENAENLSPEEEMEQIEAWENGEVIKRTTDPDNAWVQSESRQGIRIQEETSQRCAEGEMATPCYPPR